MSAYSKFTRYFQTGAPGGWGTLDRSAYLAINEGNFKRVFHNDGVLYDDNSLLYRNALNVAQTDNISNCVFVKHRSDYKEFSIYVPSDNSGANWLRYYFSNRLNVGNNGFPRLSFVSTATLSGSIGDAFTESNPSTHVSTIASVLDVVCGTGNLEYAIKIREDSGSLADFVSGTHGRETLDNFTLYIDGVLVDYANYTNNARYVINDINFIAETTCVYPDSSVQTMNISYDCSLSNMGYNYDVTRTMLKDVECEIEYAVMLISPGSTNTQRYGSGFESFSLVGDRLTTLNTYDNSVTNDFASQEFAITNSDFVVYQKNESLRDIYAKYADKISNYANLSVLTSRTDKFNKAYNQTFNTGWVIIEAGDVLNFSGEILIRKGDTTPLRWGVSDPSVELIEYSPEFYNKTGYALRNGSTGYINPNPTGDATLTGKGLTNTYSTRATLTALHNGQAIYISPVDKPFRMAVKSGTTVDQQALFYTYNL